jgi:hypothetical protein
MRQDTDTSNAVIRPPVAWILALVVGIAVDRLYPLRFVPRLALELQRARSHAEIVSLKTVSACVDAWTMLNDGAPRAKGRWRQVAAAIGVTPEALYRELARRRDG